MNTTSASRAEAPAHAPAGRKILVWDAPVRVFHAPMVLSFAGAWLSANAATGKGVGFEPPQDRITRSPWFIRKHREVAAAVWQRPVVRSAANCTACHAQAERGDFNEHQVRIPQ